MSEFSQYKNISAKLKKRFLVRKPNFGEASEQFQALGRDLQDFPNYSGYCSLAAARCEQNLANTSSELHMLLQAARNFANGGDINAAVSAYRHALKICDQAVLSSVYAEMAEMYKKNKSYLEAADAYRDGELFEDAALCFILADKHILALNCYDKIDDDQLTHEDLVTAYLLKLYVNDPRRNDVQFPVICCNSESDEIVSLNILLESLLIILKDKQDDIHTKGQITAQLYPLLNGTQRDLLRLILDEKL